MSSTRLSALLSEITRRLDRGPVEGWTDYDFEVLSEDIFTATDTRLSVTTLKRVWGRIAYRSSPSVTTLNALARFAGYDDWRSYERPVAEEGARGKDADSEDEEEPAGRRYGWFLVLGVAVLVLAGLYRAARPLLSSGPSAPAFAQENFAFSSDKVRTEGVPNAVVFRYDARAAGDYPVRISQSWDTARSLRVSAFDSVHSSQYFYPGYFNAKLLVGERVVRSHDLYITAPDWIATIQQPERPIYLDPEEFQDADTLVVNAEMLERYNVPLEPNLPEVWLTKVPDLPTIASDDFAFETTVRSDYNGGSGACQAVRVLLLLKNDAIIAPLRAEGCTGDAALFALGARVDAATADLSGFGADLSQWTSLRIEGQDRQVRFLVNDEPALTLTVEVDPKEIVGVSIRLRGPGRVGETVLRGGGYVVRL